MAETRHATVRRITIAAAGTSTTTRRTNRWPRSVRCTEDDLLRETAHLLGFRRLGKSIKDCLRRHLRAAIRPKILIRKRDIIELETFRMGEYTCDELVDGPLPRLHPAA